PTVSRRAAARTPTGRDSPGSATRCSRDPPPGPPLRMLGHVLLRLSQILRRVDGEPDAGVAEAAQLPLGGQLGKRGLLVVAALRQPRQRLLVEDVDAGVDPVRERRRLAEARDRAVVALVDITERRP